MVCLSTVTITSPCLFVHSGEGRWLHLCIPQLHEPFVSLPPHGASFCCRYPLEFFYSGPRMTQICPILCQQSLTVGCLVKPFAPQFFHSPHYYWASSKCDCLTPWRVKLANGSGNTVVPAGKLTFNIALGPLTEIVLYVISFKISLHAGHLMK